MKTKSPIKLQTGQVGMSWILNLVCLIIFPTVGALLYNNVRLGGNKLPLSQDGTMAMGAIVAIFVVALVVKKSTPFRSIFVSSKKMTPLMFIGILSVFMFFQPLIAWFVAGTEYLLNLVGLSIGATIEASSAVSTTLSAVIYSGFVAPIGEELVHRGFVARTLAPSGKKFAILISALGFAMMHGNPVQTPFAFALGLILAYVAIEYSIIWAMLLHLFNNFVYADLYQRVLMRLPNEGKTVDTVVTVILVIAGLFFLWKARKGIVEYWKSLSTESGAYKAFFTRPSVIIYLIVTMAVIVLCFQPLA